MTKFAAILTAFICMMPLSRCAAAADPKDSYIFASPNTKSGPVGGESAKNLESFEELNAISVADRIACSFTHSAGISSTLGVFNGLAENSFVVETDLVPAQIEYVASLLGKYERQEFVLWFAPKSDGPDRLWTIRVPPHEAKDVIAVMRQMHLRGATIKTGTAPTEVWIADFGGKFASVPDDLAGRLEGNATSEAGIAHLIGNDDRSKAAALFQNKIDAFERETNARLSSRLGSRLWLTASTRTCSSEVPN